MVIGVLIIVAWNKWVNRATGIDGPFVGIVANGLAMMAAHYLLPQPEDKGWVELDKQLKQAAARRKEHIKKDCLWWVR